MSLKQLGASRSETFAEEDGRVLIETPEGPRHVGHEHFWERAFSRSQFVGAAGALALGSGIFTLALAGAAVCRCSPRTFQELNY